VTAVSSLRPADECRSRTGRIPVGRESGRGVDAGCWLERHSHVGSGSDRRTFLPAKNDSFSLVPDCTWPRALPQQHGPTGLVQQAPARVGGVLVAADASLTLDSIPPIATSAIKASRSWLRTSVILVPPSTFNPHRRVKEYYTPTPDRDNLGETGRVELHSFRRFAQGNRPQKMHKLHIVNIGRQRPILARHLPHAKALKRT
jgi:hypothetical protein